MGLDVVTLGSAQRSARQRDGLLRVRSLPGFAAIPSSMASPPTVTRGAANAATTIAGGVLIDGGVKSAFMPLGCVPNPEASGFQQSNNNSQSLTSPSGAPPWAVEFYSDAPKLEIRSKAGSSAYRVMVDGQYIMTALADGTTNSVYLDAIDWSGVRQFRHYRVEMKGNFKFGGVWVGPTDTVTRAAPDDAAVIMGDSFTEPTVQDNTGGLVLSGHEGWGSIFGKMMGHRNVWLSGSGGTGYLNPGTGAKVKFRDRVVADLINKNPSHWYIAGGLNDANREPTYLASDVYTEAKLLFAQIKAALPYSQGGVFSPFCSSGGPSGSLLAFRDALYQAAVDSGLPYYDVLGMIPRSQRISTTLAADVVSAGATSISTAASIPYGTYIQIGTPAQGAIPGTIPLRTISGVSGSGPYTLNLSAAIGTLFSAGTAVTGIGTPWVTGSGRQGTTTGVGSGDLLIGSDATHPTVAGHNALGRAAFSAVLDSLPH